VVLNWNTQLRNLVTFEITLTNEIEEEKCEYMCMYLFLFGTNKFVATSRHAPI